MRRFAWAACSLALMASAVLGLPTTAAAADSMLDASTITFDGTPNQKIFTTRKVSVPAGGGLGVYGKNTYSGITTATRLEFRVYRDDGADVTSQFNVNYLNDGDVINQRVPVSTAHSYYIWAKCVFVIYNSFTSCDGTFTISSWG